MKSITKLKDEARKYEQKEEWEKAIKAYLEVLQAGDAEGSEVELPLFNRVGDLYVRLGRSGDAVKYYEQAADRYADAGLFNNAIALCNKALRYMPGHVELLRKLGQFSASQGFLTDARRYFLEYAEKKFSTGDVDAALRALEDFANVAEDAEVRELLGRKLHLHGRIGDAVRELKRAYEMRVNAGEGMAADALRAEILALDAGAFASGAPPAPVPEPSAPGPAPSAEELPGLTEISLGGDMTGAALDAEPELDGDFAIDLPGLDEPPATPAAAAEGTGSSLLEGFESTAFSGFDEADAGASLAGLEAATEFEAPADLGSLRIDGLDRPVLDVPADLPSIETTGLDETAFDLPSLDPDGGAEEEGLNAAFDLPLLGDEETEAEPLPMLEPFPAEEAEFAAPEGLADIEFPDLDEPATAGEPLPLLDDLSESAETDGWPAGLAEAQPELEAQDGPRGFEAESLLEFETEALPAAPEAEPDALGAEPLPGLEEPGFGEPQLAEPPAFGEAWPADAVEAEPFEAEAVEAEAVEAEAVEAERFEAEAVELEAGDVGSLESQPAEAEWHEAEPFAGEQSEAETARAEPLPPAAFEAEPALPEPVRAEAAAPEAAVSQDEQVGWDPSELGPAPPAPVTPAKPVKPAPEGEFIDLSSFLLEDDDEKEADTRFVVQEKAPTGDEDRDFAELLSQFKQKVAENVSAEDAAAHYDLGLAFKEMGLVDEAISEFQIALRAGDMRLKVYEELGQCFLLKEQYNIAEKVLRRALEMKYDDELELLGVYYHLGRTYEATGKRDLARDAYERVLGLDFNFRDVTERLTRL